MNAKFLTSLLTNKHPPDAHAKPDSASTAAIRHDDLNQALFNAHTPGEAIDRLGSYAEDHVTNLYAHAARAAPPIIHMTEGRISPEAVWPIADPNRATCRDPQNAIAVPKARRNPNGWAAADATNDPSAA